MLKKNILLLYFCLFAFAFYGQQKNSAYVSYIEKFAPVAVLHQHKCGIPASITLAQALLESQAGQSELTALSNNHFGIKCNNWAGEVVYYDDDTQQECFRKYRTAVESFEDHALFLKTRPRYAALFQLGATDYAAWARGLQAAGYATDTKYPDKLIKLIEDYDLHKYDLDKQQQETLRKAGLDTNNANAPPPMGVIDAWNSHIVYDNNGADCIIARAGDSFGSIADEFEISEKRLRTYNEDFRNSELAAGRIIYLKAKKSRAAKGNDFYTVKASDTMYAIAQRFAVKLEKLYEMNKMDFSEGAKTGQKIKLR